MSKKNVKKAESTDRKLWKLAISMVLDGIGMMTYLLMGFGEAADIVWAPISGLACLLLYGGGLGFFGGVFATGEELMPLTDIIPSLTIIWFIKYGLLGGDSKTNASD